MQANFLYNRLHTIEAMAKIDASVKQKKRKKSSKPIDANDDDDLSRNLQFVQEIKVEA
jgi:hypothetical protein